MRLCASVSSDRTRAALTVLPMTKSKIPSTVWKTRLCRESSQSTDILPHDQVKYIKYSMVYTICVVRVEPPPRPLWQIGVVRVWYSKHGSVVNMHFRSHSDRAHGSADDQAENTKYSIVNTNISRERKLRQDFCGKSVSSDLGITSTWLGSVHPSDPIGFGQRSRFCR